MKVFISHSSRDKWIARRISNDLSQLGIETFLDEKDIETGDSIDDAIHEHLANCDELLMLLSPAALRSHWVLLEIGGAKALKKRLVPILLHVGVNELPAPLNKGLARDLNEIEMYYEELGKRSHADAADDVLSVEVEEVPSARHHHFQVGDWVRLPDTPRDASSTSAGEKAGWVDPMDEFLGKVGQITRIEDDGAVKIDGGGVWWWAMDWLEPAKPPD